MFLICKLQLATVHLQKKITVQGHSRSRLIALNYGQSTTYHVSFENVLLYFCAYCIWKYNTVHRWMLVCITLAHHRHSKQNRVLPVRFSISRWGGVIGILASRIGSWMCLVMDWIPVFIELLTLLWI